MRPFPNVLEGAGGGHTRLENKMLFSGTTNVT